VLLIAVTACVPSGEPGTIKIFVTEGKGSAGLGVERCKGSLDPNAVLTTVVVRDGDDELVAERTLYGRDSTAKRAGVNGRRCVIKAAMKVDATIGEPYSVTAEGYTQRVRWFQEGTDNGIFVSRPIYYDTAFAGVLLGTEQREINQLRREGYLTAGDLTGIRGTGIAIPKDRVKKVIKRDDFPAPAKVVGTREFWLLDDVKAWWFRDGRHAPK
jgi:hypothetical protein